MGGRESWQPIFLDNHDATRTSVYLETTGPVDNGRTGKGFDKALADGDYTSPVGADTVNISGGSATLNLDANEVIVLH